MAPKRVSIERILCPTDLSEFSRRALTRAVNLAAWFDARVTALHVALPEMWVLPAAGYAAPAHASSRLAHAARDEEKARLERFILPFLDEGVPIELKVVDGEPWREIQAAAEALPADLVVMGTHGRSGFERLLLGSVAEKVLRRVPCPVLTVGAGDETGPRVPFQRVLCAVDLTPGSEGTLDMALSLAAENLASVTLLHVVEGSLGEAGLEPYRPVPEAAALRDVLVGQARQRLEEAGRSVRAFCDVRPRVETGRAWREILRVAEEGRSDLIVMGAHARRGLEGLLLGSTANQVVRHARCPVLVVREARREAGLGAPAARTTASA